MMQTNLPTKSIAINKTNNYIKKPCIRSFMFFSLTKGIANVSSMIFLIVFDAHAL